MPDWLNYFALALAVTVAGYKLLRVGGDQRAAGTRYLSAFFLFIGLGLAVMAEPTLILASRFEPVPNLARLVGNSLEMLAAFFLGALGQSITEPGNTRRWLRRYGTLLAAAVTLMGLLLVLADTTHTLNFVNAYSRDPRIVGYLAVFFLYIAICLVAFIRSVGGYVRYAGAGILRVGLSFVVAGAALGIVWAGWSGVRPVITLLTGRSLGTTVPIGSILGSVCMLLWLIGATLTAWGDRLAAPLRWARTLIRLRRIEPLWRALRTAVPQIALGTGGNLLTGAEFALYRRIIEIRDAQLTLRSYAHPDVPRWVGPVADPATLEAAVLAAALIGYADGRDYRSAHPFQDVDPSLASESAWLAQVARRFTGSDVVERVRRLATVEVSGVSGQVVPGPAVSGPAGDG